MYLPMKRSSFVENDELFKISRLFQNFLSLLHITTVVAESQQRRHHRVVRLKVAFKQRRVQDLEGHLLGRNNSDALEPELMSQFLDSFMTKKVDQFKYRVSQKKCSFRRCVK